MIPGTKYIKRKKGRLKCRRHRVWLEDASQKMTGDAVEISEGDERSIACFKCITEDGAIWDAKDSELEEIVEDAEDGDLWDEPPSLTNEGCACGASLRQNHGGYCWPCNYAEGKPFTGREMEMVHRRMGPPLFEAGTFVDTGKGLVQIGGPEEWTN